MLLETYSFLDTRASITGPGGAFSLSQDAGAADEGISIEMAEDKGTLTTGAGGEGMHTLNAGNAGTFTCRFLKTSPTNGLLSAMYDFQRISPRLWGKNVIVLTTPLGDAITGLQGAFVRWPNVDYAKEGRLIEWAFRFVRIDGILGRGL